jgi:non-homologous end joining protein Ku
MAPRPYWKGHLKLSLVSCPIALYPAVDAGERVSFRQINRSTGNRLRQRLVDTVTGETIEASDKARGFEVAENQFARNRGSKPPATSHLRRKCVRMPQSATRRS